MDLIGVLILGLFLFIILFFAVRLAITPLIPNEQSKERNLDDLSLVKLRDIGVINNKELEDIIEIYKSRGNKKKKSIEHDKYAKILYELSNLGYLDDEAYEIKTDLLDSYYQKK